MSLLGQDFDPYHKWLGIPAGELTRHHYALLGLQLYEADHEVINNAAEHRMSQLQLHEHGRDSATTESVIAHLAEASATLLDEELKQAYDDQLRLQLRSGKYAFYDRLRVRIRRLQQRLKIRPFEFCLISPIAIFVVFAAIGVLCTSSFGLAMLAGLAAVAVSNICILDAYVAPNPDAAEQVRTNVAARRIIWVSHILIAVPACWLLFAMTVDLAGAMIPTMAMLVVGVICFALLAYRNAQNHASATARVKRMLPERTLYELQDGSSVSTAEPTPPPPAALRVTSGAFSASATEQIYAETSADPATVTSDGFDPYHKWLGIPPHAQPADHYQLLGVQTFEDDPDVIQNLSDQRMAQLKSLATGSRSHESQMLLNEVMKATRVLMQPQTKARYDHALRQLISDSEVYDDALLPSQPVAEQLSGAQIGINIRTRSRKGSRRRRIDRRHKRGHTNAFGFVLQIFLGGVVGLAIGWFILSKWIDPRWDFWGIVSPLTVHALPESTARTGDQWRTPINIEDWGSLWREYLTFDVRANAQDSNDEPLPQVNTEDSANSPTIIWTPGEAAAGSTKEFTVFVNVVGQPALSREIPLVIHVSE